MILNDRLVRSAGTHYTTRIVQYRVIEEIAMRLPKILRYIALAAFAALTASARAEEHQNQFIPEIDAFITLSERTRLYLYGNLTENLSTNSTDSELGANVDYTLVPIFRTELRKADWARDRYLWTRVGYARLSSPDNRGDGPTERRAILELTGRIPLPNEVSLVSRGRVDLRDIGGEFSQRYRVRLGIEKEFIIGGVVTVPYIQAEDFYDTRYDAWIQQLYQTGIEIELSKSWRVEAFLARQNNQRSASSNVDQLGLTLKYYH